MIITGLQCGPTPNVKDLPHIENRLENVYFTGEASKRPNHIMALLAVPTLGASDEDRVALVNLAILSTMVLPKQDNTNIKDDHILLANDPRLFNDYPWGRVSFEALCASMKKSGNFIPNHRKGYNLEGFLHPLLAWAYEVVPQFAVQGFTGKSYSAAIPRMLKWSYHNNPGYDILERLIFKNEEVIMIKLLKLQTIYLLLTIFLILI